MGSTIQDKRDKRSMNGKHYYRCDNTTKTPQPSGVKERRETTAQDRLEEKDRKRDSKATSETRYRRIEDRDKRCDKERQDNNQKDRHSRTTDMIQK